MTNRLREVDASIRARVGSAEILVTIECRRRSAKQDVTWLEQLSSKKQALGAARTIAVSKSSFSKGAIEAAAFYGIDLRILNEITETDIQSWCFPQAVVHLYKHCELLASPSVGVVMLPGDKPGDLNLPTGGTASPIFKIPGHKESLSLDDLWIRAEQELGLYDKAPIDGKPLNIRLKLESTDGLTVDTALGYRSVKEITLEAAIRWKQERIPLGDARLVTYSAPSDPTGQKVARAEFDTKEAPKNNLRFGVQIGEGDEHLALSIQLLPDQSNDG